MTKKKAGVADLRKRFEVDAKDGQIFEQNLPSKQCSTRNEEKAKCTNTAKPALKPKPINKSRSPNVETPGKPALKPKPTNVSTINTSKPMKCEEDVKANLQFQNTLVVTSVDTIDDHAMQQTNGKNDVNVTEHSNTQIFQNSGEQTKSPNNQEIEKDEIQSKNNKDNDINENAASDAAKISQDLDTSATLQTGDITTQTDVEKNVKSDSETLTHTVEISDKQNTRTSPVITAQETENNNLKEDESSVDKNDDHDMQQTNGKDNVNLKEPSKTLHSLDEHTETPNYERMKEDQVLEQNNTDMEIIKIAESRAATEIQNHETSAISQTEETYTQTHMEMGAKSDRETHTHHSFKKSDKQNITVVTDQEDENINLKERENEVSPNKSLATDDTNVKRTNTDVIRLMSNIFTKLTDLTSLDSDLSEPETEDSDKSSSEEETTYDNGSPSELSSVSSKRDSGVSDNASDITLTEKGQIEYMVEVYLPYMQHQIAVKDIINSLHFLSKRDTDVVLSKHAYCASGAFVLLIEMIQKSDSEGKWQTFLDALHLKEYEHIKLLLENKTEVHHKHNSDLLQLVSTELERRICIPDFMDKAYEKGLLTPEDKSEAEAQQREHGDHAGAKVIIQKIDKHKLDWNTILIEILEDQHLTDIAKLFRMIEVKKPEIPLEGTTDINIKVEEWRSKNNQGTERKTYPDKRQDEGEVNISEAHASNIDIRNASEREVRKLRHEVRKLRKLLEQNFGGT